MLGWSAGLTESVLMKKRGPELAPALPIQTAFDYFFSESKFCPLSVAFSFLFLGTDTLTVPVQVPPPLPSALKATS